VYDSEDPRSTLGGSTATAARPASGEAIAAPAYTDFSRTSPDEVSAAGSQTWVVRAQNLILARTTAVAGDSLGAADLAGEMVIVVSDASCRVRVDTRHGHREVTGPALVVAPPGRSEVTALTDGEVIRLLEATEDGWAERASNAADYTRPHPRVTPLHRWPEPPGPEQVRVYPLDEVPADPTRFGRIFRTRSFMVNFLLPNDGPRDPTKLSPHTHDDFEQISYAVTGEFVHHIRTPWGADRAQWVPDQHQAVGSPSVAIIPPPTVHTTEASGLDRNWLVDIFSPPRADFSAKPGWVLNASDYPAPEGTV